MTVRRRRTVLGVVGTLARKEFRDALREHSLLVAFLVQFFLAAFSALLLTGLTALYAPGDAGAAMSGTIAYDGPGGLDGHLEAAPGITVVRTGPGEALEGFRSGAYLAVVEERWAGADGARHVTVLLGDGELESSLLVPLLKEALLEYERDLRQERSGRLQEQPLVLETGVAPQHPYAFVHTVLVPLLVLTPVFLSGALAGDSLNQEARTRTLVLLRAAPVPPGALVAGKLLVPVLLVPFQAALWLALLGVNGFVVHAPWLLLAAATLFGLLLSATGLLVGALVRREEATQAVYALSVLALAGASLLLPRDPLNVLALLAAGAADAPALASLAVVAVAAVAAATAAAGTVARRLAQDRL